MTRRARQLLPQISNPLARRVVVHMFNHGLTFLSPDDDLPTHIQSNPIAAKYAAHIRERLEKSSLHEAIPGGLDCLPDFYSSIPGFYQTWMRLRRPRNYEQFLDHLVQYLEYYVEPSKKPKISHFAFSLMGMVAIVMVILIELIVALLPQVNLPPFMTWIATIPFSILILAFVFNPLEDRSMGYKQEINATLLYRYLRDAYADDDYASSPPRSHKVADSTRAPALEGYHPRGRPPA